MPYSGFAFLNTLPSLAQWQKTHVDATRYTQINRCRRGYLQFIKIHIHTILHLISQNIIPVISCDIRQRCCNDSRLGAVGAWAPAPEPAAANLISQKVADFLDSKMNKGWKKMKKKHDCGTQSTEWFGSNHHSGFWWIADGLLTFLTSNIFHRKSILARFLSCFTPWMTGPLSETLLALTWTAVPRCRGAVVPWCHGAMPVVPQCGDRMAMTSVLKFLRSWSLVRVWHPRALGRMFRPENRKEHILIILHTIHTLMTLGESFGNW